MKFDFLNKHGDLAKGFRYIKQDGDGFIYYPHPNYKGFKANSTEELHKILVLHNSIRHISYMQLFVFFLICWLFVYSSLNDGCFKGLMLCGVGTFLFSVIIICFAYWELNRKYQKIEPEIRRIKEPIWQYNIKLICIFSSFLVLYILFFFYKYPYPFYGLFWGSKNYSKALSVVDLAIKINPKNESTYVDRAWIKLSMNNDAGAMEDFNKAIGLNSQKAYSYSARADLKYKTKDYQGALIDYNKAIILNKNDSEIPYFTNSRGLFYYKTGEYEKALNDFNTAYSQSKNDWNLLYKGMVKEAQNDYCGALIEYNSIKHDKNMDDLGLRKANAEYKCYGK